MQQLIEIPNRARRNASSKQNYDAFGIGLRPRHYQEILDTNPPIDWLEIISEDFMVEGGPALYYLDQLRERYPMAMHGVSLSIGSVDPIDPEYLKKLKMLVNRVNPLWVSDHLCWTGVNGVNLHDLMPLPHTEESIAHVVSRIRFVQDYLQRRILIENVSSYIHYESSDISEWEFLTEIVKQADCLILLDINNIFVNSFNHDFNPEDYINFIPEERVQQYHLAGHDHQITHIIDTHDHPIVDSVWNLYEKATQRFQGVATLIERDAHIPPLAELVEELNKAREIRAAVSL